MHIYGPIAQAETAASQPLSLDAHAHDAVVSFNEGNIHHMDLGTLLDRLGVLGTVRASFALYNTKEEIDTLVAGIDRVRKMF